MSAAAAAWALVLGMALVLAAIVTVALVGSPE